VRGIKPCTTITAHNHFGGSLHVHDCMNKFLMHVHVLLFFLLFQHGNAYYVCVRSFLTRRVFVVSICRYLMFYDLCPQIVPAYCTICIWLAFRPCASLTALWRCVLPLPSLCIACSFSKQHHGISVPVHRTQFASTMRIRNGPCLSHASS
jgi:hypothetical protein